jgi:hypothetical protein
VLVQAVLATLRVTGLDTGRPAWTDVTPANATAIGTVDPILETGPAGRTFVSHLQGACSLMAYTDDAGRSWTDVPLGCGVGALADHQTVGAGAETVYYCAHDGVAANCAASRDGGDTFLPAVPAWTTAECNAPHGHVSVTRDGTAYLPPLSCVDGTMAAAVSEDDGLTWRVAKVPGSVTDGSSGNPSVGVSDGGAAYLAWGGLDDERNLRPYVAVTRDRGRTWSRPAVLGAGLGVVNTKFVSAVAGDDDRAAVLFLGSATDGDSNGDAFRGAWSVYVSVTYDGGRTWRTVDALPGRLVHRGGICLGGLAGCSATSRVLLDFADLALDRAGRLVGVVAVSCPDPRCRTVVADDGRTTPLVVRQRAGTPLRRKSQ